MITQEFKGRYKALYFGQEVLVSPTATMGQTITLGKVIPIGEEPDDSFLRLRSLESITDEEAVEVARIWLEKTNGLGVHPATGIEYIKAHAKEQFKRVDCGLIDYLRSRSFALPYLGVSVDEMVKEGFVELIKN